MSETRCENRDKLQNWLSVGSMEQGRKYDVNMLQNWIARMYTIKRKTIECTVLKIHMHTLKRQQSDTYF